MKKKKGFLVPLVAVIILLTAAGAGMVVTYPNEFTVIKQFGKIVDVRQEPGLSFKIPFIQSAEKIENEVLLYDLAVSDVMTKDKKSQTALLSGELRIRRNIRRRSAHRRAMRNPVLMP